MLVATILFLLLHLEILLIGSIYWFQRVLGLKQESSLKIIKYLLLSYKEYCFPLTNLDL
jgi:hypothetical protein